MEKFTKHRFWQRLLRQSAITVVIALSSCRYIGLGYTKISELTANPQRFADQEVSVRGSVTNVLKLVPIPRV
jgi:hypothetical protein